MGLRHHKSCGGQGMNLPVYLTHGRAAEGEQDIGGYVRGLQKCLKVSSCFQKCLRDIRRPVAPFNKQKRERRKTISKMEN